MTIKTISRSEIYEYVKIYGEYQKYEEENIIHNEDDREEQNKNYVEKLSKRLNIIIDFLNRKEVREILGQGLKNKVDNFFYNKQMNLTQAKGQAYTPYDYNSIDAIFLGVLLSLYMHPSFSAYRNKPKKINPNQDQDWVEVFTKELDSFETLGIKLTNNEEWKVIRLNIESLLYSFTLINLSDYAVEIRKELENMIEDFTSLPDNIQMKIYESGMKTRINKIKEIIEQHSTNKLEKNEMNEFDPPSHQFLKILNKIDREYE